jgi:Zn-dependent protease
MTVLAAVVTAGTIYLAYASVVWVRLSASSTMGSAAVAQWPFSGVRLLSYTLTAVGGVASLFTGWLAYKSWRHPRDVRGFEVVDEQDCGGSPGSPAEE